MLDNEQVMNPEEIQTDENVISLTLPNILKCDEFYDYKVQKRFRLNISDGMQTTSFVISTHLNDTEKEIVFDKEELAINGTCYSISENAWDKLPQCKF